MSFRRFTILTLLLFLGFVLPLQAQVLGTGTLGAANRSVTANPRNALAIGVEVGGTFVGTITFQCRIGASYASILGTSVATGVAATTTTSTGSFTVPNTGCSEIVMLMTTYTSGSATVTVTQAPSVAEPKGNVDIATIAAGDNNIGNVDVLTVITGTGATNLGKAEDAAAASADTGVALFGVADSTNTTQRAADRDYTQITTDTFGTLLSRRDHPNRIRCTVAVSTATTIQAVGGSCAAPGADLSIYITDISFSTNAGAIAADSFNTLKYGTDGTCGIGTTVFWGAMNTAAVQTTTFQSFGTPIKIPANNEVCWINSTAGSKFIVILGFVAP